MRSQYPPSLRIAIISGLSGCPGGVGNHGVRAVRMAQ